MPKWAFQWSLTISATHKQTNNQTKMVDWFGLLKIETVYVGSDGRRTPTIYDLFF
jgi:hypothetical protein